MAYEIILNETILAPQYAVPFTSFFVSNADSTGLRVYRNNILQTKPAEFTFTDITLDNNMAMTGEVVFVNLLNPGEEVQIHADDTWKNNLAGYLNATLTQQSQDIESLKTRTTNLEDTVSLQNDMILTLDLRVDALEAYRASIETVVPQNTLDITTLESDVISLDSRLDRVEFRTGVDGEIAITNDQSVPLVIPEFAFDGHVYSSITIDYTTERHTGTDYRKTTGTMYLACKNTIDWAFERGMAYIDVDGITFIVTTDVGVISKVEYTTDLMAGGAYSGNMKFTIRKFEV